jgi:hypothetical protein
MGGHSRRAGARWLVLAAAIACGTLITSLPVSPAAAFHIPGAAYSGAVGGGGTISFSVSSDGSSVTNLTLTDLNSGSCALSSKQYTQPIPIASNSFDNGEVSGGFPNVQGAYGRLRIVVPGIPSSCTIATTWSAITRASPSGSEECQAAQAQVKRAKAAFTKAKKTGNQKKIKKRRAQWAAARGTRDQFCG